MSSISQLSVALMAFETGPEKCKEATDGVLKLFGSSIIVVGGTVVEGRARPGEYKGHEHFGFKDGISQPAPRSVRTGSPHE